MRFSGHTRRSAFDVAIQQLRDGRPGESGYGRRIALLLTIPTFDDPVARDVRRAASGELYVVRTVWNRALDLSTSHITREIAVGPMGRFTSAIAIASTRPPSLLSTRITVDRQALDALLENVAAAVVPCCPQQTEPPLDATIYELTFGEELSETRYRWHTDPPTGFAPLIHFATRLIHLVDEPAPAMTR